MRRQNSLPGYRDNIGRIRQQPHDHRRARKHSHREQRSRRQLRQQPHDHRRVSKHSHREQRSRRQLRQQILTVVERLCPGSRYSRCGRQIHLRKNPCHRQSRSNISWNKKSQILWMQNPLRISSLSIRIPLPETTKKEEGRTGFFAKRNKDKETDAATKAQTPQENDKETVVSAGHTGYKETAVDKTTEQVQESDKQEEQIEKLQKWGRIGQWFQTFCWMHIPIFGFWYMVVLAVRKRTPEEKKTFARAYVLYRVLVMLLALTILYVFYRMGLSFVEQILAYIDMHS